MIHFSSYVLSYQQDRKSISLLMKSLFVFVNFCLLYTYVAAMI